MFFFSLMRCLNSPRDPQWLPWLPLTVKENGAKTSGLQFEGGPDPSDPTFKAHGKYDIAVRGKKQTTRCVRCYASGTSESLGNNLIWRAWRGGCKRVRYGTPVRTQPLRSRMLFLFLDSHHTSADIILRVIIGSAAS